MSRAGARCAGHSAGARAVRAAFAVLLFAPLHIVGRALPKPLYPRALDSANKRKVSSPGPMFRIAVTTKQTPSASVLSTAMCP